MTSPYALFSSFVIILPTLLFSQGTSATEDVSSDINTAKHLSTTTAPVPIHREPPRYPLSAAKNGLEGWARLSLVIEPDGSVSNVLVTDVVGSDLFADEAIKAILKWQYEPAYEDGKPVQRCDNTVQLDFRMSKVSGVSRKFKRWYGKTKEALGNKDYPSAKLLLSEFEELGARNILENNNFEILSSDYAKAMNDKEAELTHINRIILDPSLLTEQQIFSILNTRFVLEVELTQYANAKKTYEKLKMDPEAQPYLASYSKTMESIHNLVESEKNIVVSANIKTHKFWHYSLLRNDFSLTDINGQLTKLDVRCSNKFYSYTVEENNTWSVPTTWNNCSVYVYGEDNTTFKLVEHPVTSS